MRKLLTEEGGGVARTTSVLDFKFPYLLNGYRKRKNCFTRKDAQMSVESNEPGLETIG